MKTLVIGGTRFIGEAIVRSLINDGHQVCLFNRGQTCKPTSIPWIQGDVNEIKKYRADIEQFAPDNVVHVIPYTEQHANDMVDIFRGTGTHIFAISSGDCYHAFQQFNRGQEVSDFPIFETDPVTPIKFYWQDLGHNHAGGQDYDKNLMSQALLEAQAKGEIACSIYRLQMVYGPGDPQFAYRHGDIIRRIIDGKKAFVMGAARQSKLFTYIHVDNVAAAIAHATAHRDVVNGEIYNIGEARVRTYRRWASLYAAAAGIEFDFKIVPDAVLHGTIDQRDAPETHLVVNCDKFANETGFVPPVTIEQAIASTWEWAARNPQVLKPLDYAHEDKILKEYSAYLDSRR